MWVRGLKQFFAHVNHAACQSHPMWVRGLKLLRRKALTRFTSSHPMWVRGLKRRSMSATCS